MNLLLLSNELIAIYSVVVGRTAFERETRSRDAGGIGRAERIIEVREAKSKRYY